MLHPVVREAVDGDYGGGDSLEFLGGDFCSLVAMHTQLRIDVGGPTAQ
jgi:hypothetical protein